MEGGVVCASGGDVDFVLLEDMVDPDTDDAATVGCIHAQAEEAWGCEVRTRRVRATTPWWGAFVAPITAEEHGRMPGLVGSWCAMTRGAALLACLRAAPGRGGS